MESTPGSGGEVHAHLSSEPNKGAGMSGKFEPVDESESHGRAREAYNSARRRGADLRDRVEAAGNRARDRADDIFEDAEEAIEKRTGAISTARDNPLIALGIAFALGFALAGDSDEPERHPTLAKARNQIKGAIMGGISAAISQQLRTFIEEQGGVGTLLAALGVPVPGSRGQPYFTPDDELHDL